MGEKPYTDAEIDKLKTDSAANAARLATFEAEAKTYASGINALKEEIKLRSDKVSELMEAADGMFTAEAVDAKITEAKGEMFSAEDVEAAKKEAIEVAIAAEKAKLESIAAELEVVSKMFPNGVDDAFKTEIVAMIKDGKSHEAFVKLGEVKFDSFKANIPTASGEVGAEDDVPDNGFTVGDCKGV